MYRNGVFRFYQGVDPVSYTHLQYCSAIPVGTLLAQTFDTELLEEVGRMIGAELEEFGVTPVSYTHLELIEKSYGSQMSENSNHGDERTSLQCRQKLDRKKKNSVK